jgi:hypothetical protein
MGGLESRGTADRNVVAKTRMQLNRQLPDAKKLPWPPFGRAWYAGFTTLIIGNSLKAGISRFYPATVGNVVVAERLLTGALGRVRRF